MKKTYKLEVAGLCRDLTVCKVSENLSIAAFVIFGDVEMTVAAAELLLKAAPPHDILITAESKGIPLVHEMARQSGENTYIVASKGVKLYMKEVFAVELQSITTQSKQNLYIDAAEAAQMKGKRVLIVDDVISTGESIRAVEKLIIESGGVVAGKMAILAEGDAKYRDDIIYLQYLPLLRADGTPIGDRG